jgi:membrane associated rhomboid family serine protease
MENKRSFTQSWIFTILLILAVCFVLGIISELLGIGFSGAAIGVVIGVVIVFRKSRPVQS